MGDSVEPFLLWTEHKPEGDDMAKLRQAKISSGVQQKVVPRRAFAGCGRFLAIGIQPNWVADYVYADDYDDPELPNKIKWLFEDEGMADYSMADKLSEFMGMTVREILTEKLGPDPRFEDEGPYREILRRERDVKFQ